MSFEREKKINRILLQAHLAHAQGDYLKVPIEMAQFAVREAKASEVSTYLAGLFLWPGKVKTEARPTRDIESIAGINERTVYRKINWLLERDWIGRDEVNGWLFFRGINRVHQIEGWQYSRSALMRKTDLQNAKEFYIGAVLSSIVQTGKGTGTDRTSRRSKQPRCPISLSMIQKVFGVSQKTAFTYRKVAQKAGYIKTELNTPRIKGITANDVQLMKKEDV